jgi:UDP-N-acetyl-D-glucosamine dehydrogenase
MESIVPYLHKGMLVVLESTTYPGTTEEFVKPLLESSGLECGKDFFLAYSPERVDPGNQEYKTSNTPKVVGGVTETCCDLAASLYEGVLHATVHKVSSPAIAEMEKILENAYRNINIGLVNELAILCNRMNISIWEVIDAARSKPYGFQAFYPGPGLGGHCIPLDPYYLSWKAREFGFHTSMIEASMTINDGMPEYCVQRAVNILNKHHKPLRGSRILMLGVAYKKDVDDCRESPAIRIYEKLLAGGAQVVVFDPQISEVNHKGAVIKGQERLTRELVENSDLVIIATGHTNVDYDLVVQYAKAVFDTRGVTKELHGSGRFMNIELL